MKFYLIYENDWLDEDDTNEIIIKDFETEEEVIEFLKGDVLNNDFDETKYTLICGRKFEIDFKKKITITGVNLKPMVIEANKKLESKIQTMIHNDGI